MDGGSTGERTAHRWIDTPEKLHALVQDIEKKIASGEVTACYVDTEADSLHHYQEKLCLIQLAVGGEFALIDSLAISEMQPLLAAFDKLEVWMHGADYDLTLFKRTYGWLPRLVRDTQIAARLAGHKHFGLASLIEQHFKVILSKASQKADWSQRPLPPKMLAYAVDDVHWLPQLVEILQKELAAKNRGAWFLQSCEDLCMDVLARQERDREDAWRVNGSGSLRPKGLAALRVIWSWRDGMARDRDAPPFRILNNQQMISLALEFEANDRVSLPPRWRPSWRTPILDAIDQIRGADPETWPQRPRKHGRRTTDAERERIDKLCKSRDKIAESLGIDNSLLGSRAVMEELILQREGDGHASLMPWQRELLAETLQNVGTAQTAELL